MPWPLGLLKLPATGKLKQPQRKRYRFAYLMSEITAFAGFTLPTCVLNSLSSRAKQL